MKGIFCLTSKKKKKCYPNSLYEKTKMTSSPQCAEKCTLSSWGREKQKFKSYAALKITSKKTIL